MSLLLFLVVSTSSLVWLPIPAAFAAPLAEANAYVTANVNLRAGPDTDYPAVIIIPAEEYVTIYACIEDLTWCDISYGENRGWVSAQYVQPFYEGRYMTVQEYAPLVSLPRNPFDIRLYWNSFYSSQPFYRELDAWAAPGPAVRTNSFYEPLGSYGDWVEEEDQYVWVPRGVDPSWRPYTRGHWVDTDQYGWFWASDEPFGWATYHYGRWGFSHDVGWFWVPGTRWAPAWVAWRGSDDYLGWAPLPPAPDDGLSISVNVASVPDYYWQVVPARSFLAVDLSVEIVHDDRVFRPAFERTRPLGNVTIVNNIVVNKVVNINYVEQKTHRKVVIEKVAAAGAPDPTGKGSVGKVAVFTPPAGAGGSPRKLKRVDEVALVSKTKVQAGGKPAMDLATLKKLKGPPPGKKPKSGPPPPPSLNSPTGPAKTLNAVKSCPPGQQLRGNQCVPVPPGQQQLKLLQCPPGQQLRGNQCVAIQCPPGRQLRGNQCVANPCPPGQQLRANQCVPAPAGQQQLKLLQCPPGQQLRGNQCVPIQCPPGRQLRGNQCVPAPAGQQQLKLLQCPPGQQLRGNQCVPIACPPGQQLRGNQCVGALQGQQQFKLVQCPPGRQLRGGQCVPIACPPGQQLRGNQCVGALQGQQQFKLVQCPPGQQLRGNQCVPIQCPPGLQLRGGQCVPIACPPGQQLRGNQCVGAPQGQQQFKLVQCPPGQQLRGNQCVPIACPPGQQLRGNQCVGAPQAQQQFKLVQCPPGLQLRGGQCVPVRCPPGQQMGGDSRCHPVR